MNRLFIKLMWTVAAIMVCVVFAVLAARAPQHGSPAGRTPATATATRAAGTSAVAPAGTAAADGVVRSSGSSR